MSNLRINEGSDSFRLVRDVAFAIAMGLVLGAVLTAFLGGALAMYIHPVSK